jgi:predicted acetyltransferase
VPVTVRAITPEELIDWVAASQTAFFIWPGDPVSSAEARRKYFEYDRTIGAFDGEAILGTHRTFAFQLALPGGLNVPVSGVTNVAVRPTHRRQGILSRLVAHDLATCVARGDVASVLISAEWPIYGRFGYGPATWQAKWTLRARAATFAGDPAGSVEILRPEAARAVLPEIYGRYQAGQPGEITKPDWWWDVDLGLIEMPGRTTWRGSVAIHRDVAGVADGFVRYRGEEHWDDGIPDNTLVVDDLHGVTVEAELELWRYLAQTDLVASIQATTRRPREPMQWYLSDSRAARVTGLTEFLWVRPLDVERLLGGRTYDSDGDLVIEVLDQLDGKAGPAAGRYRLEAGADGSRCARTTAAPDLTISAAALGAASLGGTRLVDMTRAGGATEHRPGILQTADRLFRTAEDPWCSTWF